MRVAFFNGLATALLAARVAVAQTSPSDVSVPTGIAVLRSTVCPTMARANRFAHLLAVELASARIQLLQDVPAPAQAIAIETDGAICDAEAREVDVSLLYSGSRAIKRIDLADTPPDARLRALALTTAELVRAAQGQIAAEGALANAVRDPVPAESKIESTKITDPPSVQVRSDTTGDRAGVEGRANGADGAIRHRRDVRAAALWRFFAPESTSLLGATAGAGFRLRPDWLAFHADATATWSSAEDLLGDVGLALYTGGISLLASTAQNPEFEIGPHFELGYARAVASSKPGVAGSVDGRVMALASLRAGARFWADRWAFLVEVESGAALSGAEIFADDRRIAAIGGFFAGARAGLGFGY